MKNTFKVLTIAAFVAAAGFLFASCDSNGDSGGSSGSEEDLATINNYDRNGNLTNYIEYEHGSNGRITKQNSYSANGVLTGYSVWEYGIRQN